MPTPLRVLLVEDIADEAALVVRALERGGYEVAFERVETEEGMRAAIEQDDFDIIISDYVLPRFSGPLALRLRRELRLGTPLVMVSGRVGDDVLVESVRAGAADYVRKDDIVRLVPIVKREVALARERRESPAAQASDDAPAVGRRNWAVPVSIAILWAGIAVALLVLGAVFVWEALTSSRALAEMQAQAAAREISLAMVQVVEDHPPTRMYQDPASLQSYVTAASATDGCDLVVTDRQGRVLADTKPGEVGPVYGHDPADEVDKTIADGQPRVFSESRGENAALSQAVVPLRTAQGEIVGAVIREYTTTAALVENRRNHNIVSVGLLVGLVVMGFAISAPWYYRSIVFPVERARQDVERIRAGDLTTPVRVGHETDLGGLTASFERMRCDLVRARAISTASLEQQLTAENALQEAHAKLSNWVATLEARRAQITALSELGGLMQACTNLSEVEEVVSSFAARIFPHMSGALYGIPPSRDVVEPLAHWGASEFATDRFASDDCWALRRGRVHVVDDLHTEPVCEHVASGLGPDDPYVCMPMMAQGEPIGLLHLRFPDDSPCLNTDDQALAAAMAEQIGLAISNLKLRDVLRMQSIRDALTGLFNRRYLDESLALEVERATRSGSPLGIVMLDIDRFKTFNDVHGHDAGDAVLHALGACLQSHVRSGDVACRYGGEEFAMILPGASLEATRERADALREAVGRLGAVFDGQTAAPITISAGVAVFPEHGETVDALLKAADMALYRAKEGGRNRVEAAE